MTAPVIWRHDDRCAGAPVERWAAAPRVVVVATDGVARTRVRCPTCGRSCDEAALRAGARGDEQVRVASELATGGGRGADAVRSDPGAPWWMQPGGVRS